MRERATKARARGVRPPRAEWIAPALSLVFAAACLVWFSRAHETSSALDELFAPVAVRSAPLEVAHAPLAERTSRASGAAESAVFTLVDVVREAPPASAAPRDERTSAERAPVVAERTRDAQHETPAASTAPAPGATPADGPQRERATPPAHDAGSRSPAPPVVAPPAAAPGVSAPAKPVEAKPKPAPQKRGPTRRPDDPTDIARSDLPRGHPGWLPSMGQPGTSSGGGVPGGGGGGGGGGGPSTGNPSGPSTGAPAGTPITRSPELGDEPASNGAIESANGLLENPFRRTSRDATSTFSIDVDTASYTIVRRFLDAGQLPPPDVVRVEEFVNYFRYDYDVPRDAHPFAVRADVATCPWAPEHELVRIGLRATDVDLAQRQASNLVFLVDVSGSMSSPEKLPLLVSALKLLTRALDARDTLAIVVYAGSSGLVLPPTTGDYRTVIENALDGLRSGGSTNGGEGIELAYRVATENFVHGGQNRVILCTDGDFNVGVTDPAELQRLIEAKRRSGVFLSVLGFGHDATGDATMELLADKGNGNYAYVDTYAEARKVLGRELGATLVTVAADVKVQVEFDSSRVQAWRLIGYENRVLAHEDFDDDAKDAGEIGAGHTVTALYEIVPVGVPCDVPDVPRLPRPGGVRSSSALDFGGAPLCVKLRYKRTASSPSTLLVAPVHAETRRWQDASADFRFAAAVAAFGMTLRGSAHAGKFTLRDVLALAVQGVGDDTNGDRREFVELVRRAQRVADGVRR